MRHSVLQATSIFTEPGDAFYAEPDSHFCTHRDSTPGRGFN
jgi:hypothetical protein